MGTGNIYIVCNSACTRAYSITGGNIIMRNLYTVIDSMLEIIPPENERLIERLNAIKSSLGFAAPEMTSFWWNECANALNSEIPVQSEDWHFKLVKIFSGKE
jgi:hypothetical protein